jgi:hypothetical protein
MLETLQTMLFIIKEITMTLRRLIALFLVFVLVFPLTMAALSLIAVSPWALDRNFYIDLVSDERLYDVLLSEEIPRMLQREVLRGELEDAPAAAIASALRAVVTPEYLRSESVRIINDVFDAIEGQGDTQPFLDLRPIKDNVLAKGAQFAQAYVADLPACAAGVQPTFIVETRRGRDATLYRCVPSDLTADQVANDIVEQLSIYVEEIPDQVDLSPEPIRFRTGIDNVFRFSRGEFAFFDVVGALNFSIVVLLLIAGGAWFVTALIGGEDQRGRLLWLGSSLMPAALLIFFIGVAINAASDPLSTAWFRPGVYNIRFGNAPISEESARVLLEVFGSTLDTIANGFLASGAISGAIALTLLAFGWMTRPASPTLQPVYATPVTVPSRPIAAPPQSNESEPPSPSEPQA